MGVTEEKLTFTTLSACASVHMRVYVPAHQAPEGRDSIHLDFVFLAMPSTVPDTEAKINIC